MANTFTTALSPVGGSDAIGFTSGTTPPLELKLMAPASTPVADTDHSVELTTRVTADTASGAFELRQGTTVIESWTESITSTFQTFTHALSATNVANITDYTDLRLRAVYTGSAGASAQLATAKLKAPIALPGSGQAISASDSGTASQSQALAATFATSDASTATTPSQTVAVAATSSDTGASTTTATVVVSVAGSDTGTSTTSAAVAVAATDSDTGTGITPTQTVAVSATGSDTGTSTTSTAVSASVSASDASTATTPTQSVAAQWTVADTATSSDIADASSFAHLPPDAILSSDGTGVVTYVQDDPDLPDANNVTNVTSFTASFPSPPANLKTGADRQKFRVRVKI